jgi:hypothetical protein
MKHSKVADKWRLRQEAKGARMYTDGTTIWSYGAHWPLGIWMDFNTCVLNVSHYSSSTAGHLSDVREALRLSGKTIIKVVADDAKAIQDVVHCGQMPGIMVLEIGRTKEEYTEDLDMTWRVFEKYLQQGKPARRAAVASDIAEVKDWIMKTQFIEQL